MALALAVWSTMPTLAVNNFNIVVSVLGGWISLFGLVSYLLKENFYLSEARKSDHLVNPKPLSISYSFIRLCA